MPKTVRIIARLDIKGPHLVKGIHLEGLRVLGEPEQFARHYYETGADELVYMDAVASLYERNSLHDVIEKTSREIFIPLTVGGGLRTVDDIRNVLRSGADKVALNTAAIRNPGIIRDASRSFGSSTIVVSIDTIRQTDGKYLAYTDNGREFTGVEVMEWARRAEELGAGEIMLTSIDREGTGAGFDIELLKMVTKTVSIPVIACGGAGKLSHIEQAISEAKVDAVALASMLHYDYARYCTGGVDTASEGNIEFLKSGKNFSKVDCADLRTVKEYLLKRGIVCRTIETTETTG